jgi:hypothetical protein
MALWEAYFDESGDDGRSTEFVIGGYVMPSDRAKLMETSWNEMLVRYGVSAFHMVDCAHGSEDFKNLGKDRCDQIAREAISLVNKFATYGMCYITNTTKMKSPHDVYSFLGANLLLRIEGYIRSKDKDADLACFFESGHGSQQIAKKEFETVCEKYSAGVLSKASVTFAPKCKLAILQAADLLCWQTSKFIKDKFITKARRPRKDFLHLMRHSLHGFYFINIGDGNDAGFGLNWIPDQFPTGPDKERDEYLAAMFANTPESEAFLTEWHRASDANFPKNTIDLSNRKPKTR